MLCSLLRVHAEVSPSFNGSEIKTAELPILEGFFFSFCQRIAWAESTGEQREPGPLMLGAQGAAYLQSLLGPQWHGNALCRTVTPVKPASVLAEGNCVVTSDKELGMASEFTGNSCVCWDC